MSWEMNRKAKDRLMHGVTRLGEIVRYNVSGKWYFEPLCRDTKRRRLTVREAAGLVSSHAQWYPGRPGGATFDLLVRKRLGGEK